VDLVASHFSNLDEHGFAGTTVASAPLADPIVPPLTNHDTSLYPSPSVNTYIAYISPWIDLCSPDPIISNISRQVLNLEVNYANFCGVRSIIIPGPRHDAAKDGTDYGLTQYARAIQEALTIGSRVNFLVHMPMYREPGLEEKAETLTSLLQRIESIEENNKGDIDLFSAWDSWHLIRSVCSYNTRLLVGESMSNFTARHKPCAARSSG
jgi:type II protein arginine methyltransferase